VFVAGQQSPSSGQRSRRIQSSVDRTRISFPSVSNSRSSSSGRKQQSKRHGVPAYAVQMEPLVQYSQPDPLYTIEKQLISDAKSDSSNDLIKKTYTQPMVAHITEAESRVGQITHARIRPPTHLSPPPARPHYHSPHHHHHHHHPPKSHHHSPHHVEFSSYGTLYEGPPEAFEPPEPIIEIIIKESNESLPAPPPLPTPPPPKKVKEAVQVFYVKYKKDPSGGYGGEDKVIYDPPIPAITPPTNNEESHETETEPALPVPEYGPEEVSVAPPPSTTLKAIIRPDSETFDASGVHITFGGPEDDHHSHEQPAPEYGVELEQQSASQPKPVLALPSKIPSKPSISRSSTAGVSTITKRNPGPYHPVPSFQPNFPQPTVSTFQKTPQHPPRDFQPPSFQYSTIPQNFQLQSQQQQQQPAPQFQPQRYTTINNPPPPQQYNTFNNPPVQFPSPSQQFPRNQLSLQDQHQRQVEQINRLQHQQQQLQAQFSQQHRFQPFNQPSLQPSQPFPAQHVKTQFTQQASIEQFPQQSSQHSQPLNQPQTHQFSPQHQQPPQLSYTTHSPEFNRPVEATNSHFNHRSEVPTTPRPHAPTYASSPIIRQYSTTTSTPAPTPTPEIVTEDPVAKEKERKRKEEQEKKNIGDLPDEVPSDLRDELLKSGILKNADIQILDYDKIGDIPIESLPPDALAGFQQAAGSEKVSFVRKPDSVRERHDDDDDDADTASSEQRSVVVNTQSGEMEMKVVRYNSGENSDVAKKYMKTDAKRLAPVVLNDNKYNRYLPLKVSGAQFPVPDVPELRGRNVTSVVVLAPVDYEFINRKDDGDSRVGRSATPVLEVQGVHFVAGDVLKKLVKMPTTDNYKRWLDKENMTAAEQQSVVLLVVE